MKMTKEEVSDSFDKAYEALKGIGFIEDRKSADGGTECRLTVEGVHGLLVLVSVHQGGGNSGVSILRL